MTLLAALVLAQAPATAADFFPLVPGPKRVYELKAKGTTTVADEVGGTAIFDGKPAVAIVRHGSLDGTKETNYYRVDGATVLMVGSSEDRRSSTGTVDNPLDADQRDKSNVLLPLVPAMPLFKYEGKPTQWTYTETPTLDGRPTDAVAIAGSSKPGPIRTVLGRKVETIEVRAEVRLGTSSFVQNIVETTVYGRGIGMIESTRKSKAGEIRTRLVGLEEKSEGG